MMRMQGFFVTPQIELIPVGPDPRSGLWEFAHLPSGSVPERDANGELLITHESGIVFVLLPGGRVNTSIGIDGWQSDTGVAPFFISKFELTVDHWVRLGLRQIDWRDAEDRMLPAHSFSWLEASDAAHAIGPWIRLPPTSEWVYASAGWRLHPSRSDYWDESLAGAANPRGDGRGVQPIGTRCANPFGIHDMSGKVAEWLADDGRGLARALGDGDDDGGRLLSASAYDRRYSHADGHGEYRIEYGLRPARPLMP